MTASWPISNFKSEPYFELLGTFGTFKAKWSSGEIDRLKTQSEAEDIVIRLSKKLGTITKLDTQPKSQERPLLFDLTELQREANRRYGYTAQETLNIAQASMRLIS